MNISEQLYRVGNELPPEYLLELIDFAEFLKHKHRLSGVSDSPLMALAGGLENSVTFADSPLKIQEKLRHEWD